MARDGAPSEEATPLRLFTAVDLPPRTTSVVEREAAAWRERLGAGRWVPAENWHVTVTFLGRVWPRLAGWVADRVRAAASEVRPFETGLTSFGVFPRRSSARVLWVGLDDRSGGWDALYEALAASLAAEFPPERRGYTAHLTVARFEPTLDLRPYGDELERAIAAPRFRVGEVVLYRSHLQRPAPRYEPVGRFPLRRR